MQSEINDLAEFRDMNKEKAFHDNEVKMRLRLSGKIVLIFAAVNFLFVCLDYKYLQYKDISIIIHYSLIPRAITLLVAVFVFTLLKKVEDKSTAIKSIVFFAVFAYLVHEYIAVHFAPVNVTFEILDLVIITYGLYIIPNRWITNTCASTLLIVLFLLLTPFTIPTMEIGTKTILIIYFVWQEFMQALLIYKNDIQKRLNYLQQLQLENIAKTDALTGAFNRAACNIAVHQMCTDHLDFSLIMIDIDNFKNINDTCGHLVGDQVIVKAAEIIKTNVRKDDIVARWGGDEFIIVLPHTSRKKAIEISERIKNQLSTIKYCNERNQVTASLGITLFAEGDNVNSIVNRADLLLYQAKDQGKNGIACG